MAITALYEDSATIGDTEYSLPNDSTTLATITTDGVFQIFLDFNALAVGDTYELRVYETVTSGGSKRVITQIYISGVQTSPVYVLPSMIFLHGWDVTLKKISGTDRSIGWSIRQVA